MREWIKIFFMLVLASPLRMTAQIPYFAGTAAPGKLYGYTSVKSKPGINHQETYTCFQYGLPLSSGCSDNEGRRSGLAAGLDLYTGPDCSYWGALVRYGYKWSKWFNVGAEVTPSFNLNNNFRFAYLTSALYLNGAITADGRLFWCTNTWWIANEGVRSTFSNYEYLGYTIGFNRRQSITPMVGALHSWRFDASADLAAGCYWTIDDWNLYLWGNGLLEQHPRIVVGIDFTL